MVTRLLLSLKKASNSRPDAWNLTEPGAFTTVVFTGDKSDSVTKDEVQMGTLCEDSPKDSKLA